MNGELSKFPGVIRISGTYILSMLHALYLVLSSFGEFADLFLDEQGILCDC